MRQVFQIKNKPHGFDRGKQFLDEGFVCIGWPGIGNLENADKNDIRRELEREYRYDGQRLGAYTGVVNMFVNVVEPGDIILVPDGSIVYVGIAGPYQYLKEYDDQKIGMCHRRPVEWRATVAKSSLDQKVVDFVKNRGTMTKFSGRLDETRLAPLLKEDMNDPFAIIEGKIELNTNDGMFDEEIVRKAKDVLLDTLNSNDPDLRMKAAIEILRLSRN
ncbi:hypothetical protein HNY42_16005 (plasmid) [Exiguobacterium sp. Helios]|uniref:hypothetical protein n=1 Tax=unclassified Exiguobacterium TaxID=2644629 RepID=UPI00165E3F1C|nr:MULTISPECIES: hypothetical protein [unclassified Exiguobacterium]QNR22502.1 hypothetical protein HNY42_16005 [Exiguobacterium sp. Helios]